MKNKRKRYTTFITWAPVRKHATHPSVEGLSKLHAKTELCGTYDVRITLKECQLTRSRHRGGHTIFCDEPSVASRVPPAFDKQWDM